MNSRTDTENTSKVCAWCGLTMIKPRSNQTYCNAECRTNHKHSRKGRNAALHATRTCECCDKEFEPRTLVQEFCSAPCQQVWNNFWKSKGPKLAKAFFSWRVKREPKGMTKACQEFAAARRDWKYKKEDMKE